MLSTEQINQINFRLRKFQSDIASKFGVKLTLGIMSISYNEYSPTVGNKTELIMQTVAAYFKISLEEMMAKCRKRTIIDARSLAIYFIKEQLTGLTYSEIGRMFNADHATIYHAYTKCLNLFQTNNQFRTYRDELIEILKEAQQ